jgi:hypothetical protein
LSRLFGGGRRGVNRAASALEDDAGGDASDALGGTAQSLTSALGDVATDAVTTATTAATGLASGLASTSSAVASTTGEILAATAPVDAIPGIGEVVMGLVALGTALGLGLGHKRADVAAPPDVTFQAGA